MPLRQRPARRTRVDQDVAGPPVVEEEQYVPPRRPPMPQIWPWLLLLLLLVIGGLLAAYFLTRDNDHKGSASAVSVPAVVGLKQSNAVRQLNDRGLVPRLATKPSKFPAGSLRTGSGRGDARQSGLAREVVGLGRGPDTGTECRRDEDIGSGFATQGGRIAVSGDGGPGQSGARRRHQGDPGGGNESRQRLDRLVAGLER